MTAELIAPTDLDTAREGVRALLRLMGEDPDRSGLADTPNRFVKAWIELTDQPGKPAELLSVDARRLLEVTPVGSLR